MTVEAYFRFVLCVIIFGPVLISLGVFLFPLARKSIARWALKRISADDFAEAYANAWSKDLRIVLGTPKSEAPCWDEMQPLMKRAMLRTSRDALRSLRDKLS